MNKEPVFWYMFEMIDDNKIDLFKSMLNGELLPVVSEIDGGIIAYAIGKEHAELIMESLNNNKPL